jgi:NAD(P)-dependent dehydrogenase (short-subunit alcohol dehydrogenase family)
MIDHREFASMSDPTPSPSSQAKQVLTSRKVALITGGASGIGYAAAKKFIALGMRVAIADLPGDRLAAAEKVLGGRGVAMAVPTDVSDPDAIRHLERAVLDAFGSIDLLMNNAGVQPGSDIFGPPANWARIIDTNLMGIVHGTQIIVPGMLARGTPGMVINTGSKQGITTPPGDPAYNVAKAGVKAFTEALQHHLRNIEGGMLSAHLLIPGFVFTGLTARGRADKPDSAWTPEQTVDFMVHRLEQGDFYILCPDNDVPRATDEKRILWAAGDLVENRPPLSRWHPGFKDAFDDFTAR